MFRLEQTFINLITLEYIIYKIKKSSIIEMFLRIGEWTEKLISRHIYRYIIYLLSVKI